MNVNYVICLGLCMGPRQMTSNLPIKFYQDTWSLFLGDRALGFGGAVQQDLFGVWCSCSMPVHLPGVMRWPHTMNQSSKTKLNNFSTLQMYSCPRVWQWDGINLFVQVLGLDCQLIPPSNLWPDDCRSVRVSYAGLNSPTVWLWNPCGECMLLA